MRLGLALGAAVIATTMVAYAADTNTHRRFVFHRGGEINADANNDGWLSRDEAAAQADRLFADLDRNNNGSITEEDHEILAREIEVEVEEAMRHVEINLEGLDEEIERSLEGIDDENCETTTENDNGNRRVTTICRSEDNDEAEERADRAERDADRAERDAARAERRVDREVRVIRHGGDMIVGPVPPVPPVPPMPPMRGLMWMGDDEEADLNGDGALSREEFRAQQIRYFDARDANGDGRIRYEEPPEPPQPPAPPAPPEPPRRHH